MTTIWTVAVATGETGASAHATAGCRPGRPTIRRYLFVSADRRHAPASSNRARTVGGQHRRARAAHRDDVKNEGLPSAAAWSPDGNRLTYVAGGILYLDNRPLVKGGDVFPFRPQWLPTNELLYTADGRIQRFGMGMAYTRDGVAMPESGSTYRGVAPFTAKVSLQRSSYTIAHRPLEPSGPQRLTGIVNPVVSPDGRANRLHGDGRSLDPACRARPVQLTNDVRVEIEPAWSPDSTRVAFVSDRGGHMDVWVHDLRDNRIAQLTQERGAVSAPLVARREPHRVPGRSPRIEGARSPARSASLRVRYLDVW
jgi:hypothetical protein